MIISIFYTLVWESREIMLYKSKGSCSLSSTYIRALYQCTLSTSLQVIKRGNDKARVKLSTVKVHPFYIVTGQQDTLDPSRAC